MCCHLFSFWFGWHRSALAVALASGIVAASFAAPRAIPQRHLFLDPAVLLAVDRAVLRANPPVRDDVVIRADRPWEEFMISFYTTVLDENGRLRLWYICRDAQNRPNVAYAESTDGVTWTKPSLGIVDYEGSTDNNLVGLSPLEGAVYRDPHGGGDARYVYVSTVYRGGGVFRFTSPDGLRWKRDAEPLLPFESDSQNVTFWDESRQRYRIYLRGWGPKTPRDDRRRVVLFETDSLTRPRQLEPAGPPRHESDPERQPWFVNELPVVLACDERDPAGVDVYTNSVQPYPPDPRWYVGFPAFYRHFRDSPHRNDGRTEVQFAGSRDGVTWHRYDRAVYAGPGLPGPHGGNMIYLGTGLVVRGDEIWQYGTRFRTTHGDKPGRAAQADGAIYRFVQRIDGFVSLDFADEGGRARLAAVTVDADRMFVNVDTGALGELRVGLLDEHGAPLPGFGVADCEPLQINSTKTAVRWKGSADVSALQGRRVQVVLEGRRAKLFAYFFEDHPTLNPAQ